MRKNRKTLPAIGPARLGKMAHHKKKRSRKKNTEVIDELDEQPSDPGPHPAKSSAESGAKRQPQPAPEIRQKNESAVRLFVRQTLLMEMVEPDLVVKKSPIAGDGVFANKEISAGSCLGVSHVKREGGKYDITDLGHMHNHSYEPNCENVMSNGTRRLYALRDIAPGEEITVDYTLQPDLEQPQPNWN